MAFDKVVHKRFLSKLLAQGTLGNIHNWLLNWSSERKQRVVTNRAPSYWLEVRSSVPQGSVIGPMLFIYVNHINNGLTCKMLKQADNTKIASKVTMAWHSKTRYNQIYIELHVGPINSK